MVFPLRFSYFSSKNLLSCRHKPMKERNITNFQMQSFADVLSNMFLKIFKNLRKKKTHVPEPRFWCSCRLQIRHFTKKVTPAQMFSSELFQTFILYLFFKHISSEFHYVFTQTSTKQLQYSCSKRICVKLYFWYSFC